MLILASTGLKQINDSGLTLLGAGNGQIGLFTNNHTPAEGDTIAAYTEPAGAWYGRQGLGNWPASTYLSPAATSINAPVTWTNTVGTGAAATVYGYFVVNAAGVLMWAELDPAGPFDLANVGYTYTVTPTFDQENQ